MKNDKNHDNSRAAVPGLVPVRFEFNHPIAETVSLAGCFNHWQPDIDPLHPSGRGRWLKEMHLPPGSYEYRFIVDGQWMPDPRASETIQNPFGGRNSVLRVTASNPEATHLAEAEHLPLTTPKKTNALLL